MTWITLRELLPRVGVSASVCSSDVNWLTSPQNTAAGGAPALTPQQCNAVLVLRRPKAVHTAYRLLSLRFLALPQWAARRAILSLTHDRLFSVTNLQICDLQDMQLN